MNAVITYIFGKNQEILRDPLVIDPGVEYICVTDQKTIKSKKWNIVYDTIPEAKCTRDKMPHVKYNPFKYTKANKIFVIDGSLQVRMSLLGLFNRLGSYDLMIKQHPQRDTLEQELIAWNKHRDLPYKTLLKFIAMAEIDMINLGNNFLVESCMVGYNVSPSIRQLCYKVIRYMEFLGENGILCPTNQCVLTYLLQKHKMKYRWLNQYAYCNRYQHNTWKANPF